MPASPRGARRAPCRPCAVPSRHVSRHLAPILLLLGALLIPAAPILADEQPTTEKPPAPPAVAPSPAPPSVPEEPPNADPRLGETPLRTPGDDWSAFLLLDNEKVGVWMAKRSPVFEDLGCGFGGRVVMVCRPPGFGRREIVEGE